MLINVKKKIYSSFYICTYTICTILQDNPNNDAGIDYTFDGRLTDSDIVGSLMKPCCTTDNSYWLRTQTG